MAEAIGEVLILVAFVASPVLLAAALATAAFSTRHRWSALYAAGGCVAVTLLVAFLMFLVGGYE